MAQLVERLVRNEEASGSNPLISTKKHLLSASVFYVFCGYCAKAATTQNTHNIPEKRCEKTVLNLSIDKQSIEFYNIVYKYDWVNNYEKNLA